MQAVNCSKRNCKRFSGGFTPARGSLRQGSCHEVTEGYKEVIKIEYNRQAVVEYASKWAYSRNPNYYNYDAIGGDCTNFVSQCIFAGCKTMNYSKYGWYYKNANDKSASWTGVEFLHKFLINNKSIGPHGMEVPKEELDIGDVVQLSFNGSEFVHTLIIVGKANSLHDILVASHTIDSYGRSLNSYSYSKARYIKINKIVTKIA